MNLLYDAAGTILYAVPDAQAATFTHTTNALLAIYHIDEILDNATIINDVAGTLFDRDQNRNGKYWVSGGVLTLRQGWLPAPPPGLVPFAPDPSYQTTDQAVALVSVQPKVLAQAALTDPKDATRIAARCTARVLMSSLIEVRAAYNQLAAWARPLGYTGPTLINRTFAQAILATQAVIGSESDPTQ